MSRKPKDGSIAEGAADLATQRRAFHEVSLEYNTRLNEILEKEQLRVAEAVATLCHSRIAFCDKERAIFEDVSQNLHFLEHLAGSSAYQLSRNSLARTEQRTEILQRSETFYNPVVQQSTAESSPKKKEPSTGAIEKSGFLYKRSSHAMRPVWSRRFFHLHDNILEYYTLEGKNNSATNAIDLRLCTVKTLVEASERRNVFEIVSPVKTYTLQAESDRDYEEWVAAIQASIHAAIHEAQSLRP